MEVLPSVVLLLMLRLSLGAWSPITAYPWKKHYEEPRLPVSNLAATTVV